MSKKKVREIPYYESAIIETHCHLDYLKERSIDETLDLSHKQNISKIITISVSPDNLLTVREIANKYAQVYCSQGIHPHNAKDWNELVKQEISSYLEHKKVVAVGEIGLDYYYNSSEPDQQRPVFQAQIEMAKEFKLPMIIHSRDAEEDTIELLEQYADKDQKAVIHSFTSKIELARYALSRGFYLGFNGIITFKNAKEVQKIVEITPIEQILLETDSPFLAPTPYRGRENAPFYLPFVAEKIAEIKNIDIESVISITTKNAQNLFQLED